MLLPLIVVQAIAFGTLNNRVVQMLPVSRRDIWRAKWILVTLGAATLTTAAQALTMVMSRVTAPAASDALIPLVVTWLSTFILGGVLLASWLWMPRLLPAPGVVRNLLTPIVWFRNLKTYAWLFLRNELTTCAWLLLAVVFIIGAIRVPGLLLRYVTMDWHDISAWSSIATVLALLVAIAPYWHRPRVYAGAGRLPQATTEWSRATLIPRGTLSAIRLLVFERVVSACLASAVTLGVITALMTAIQPFREAVARIASSFGLQSASTTGGGFLLMMLFILGGAGSFADKFNARHLRALPLSTLQLTGLLLLPALLFWLAMIAIVSGVHLAVIGTLPRIDASFLALGLTALWQPLQLRLRGELLLGMFGAGFFSLAFVLMQGLDVLASLTHTITVGFLLLAIAVVWSYKVLTRSSAPFRAPPALAAPPER
jgi:hypothetical protein